MKIRIEEGRENKLSVERSDSGMSGQSQSQINDAKLILCNELTPFTL